MSADDLPSFLPTYDQRRHILATDALASVEGFRVMLQLTLQHLFGVNDCPNCPDCSHGANPCQDLFGSSARAEGGIFGRVDVVFTSLEAQTSKGSLHAHSQVFVQCLHQHTPSWEIVKQLRKSTGLIANGYLDCKTHVCRHVYTSDCRIVDMRLGTFESHWREYKTATNLTSSPWYLREARYDLTCAQTTEGYERYSRGR